MKVNDPKLSGLNPAQIGGPQGTEAAAERSKRTESTGSGGRDQISLSSLSGRIREMDSESPERAAYLERLSADVQSGRYKVDAMTVSKKIIGDALDKPE